jgi:hypothetical protein
MNRRGVALLLALLALVIAGALATSVLALARLRWLSGYRQLAARQALEAAAGAAASHAAQWDASGAGSLSPGIVVPLAGRSFGSLVTRDSLVRLGPNLYLVRSVALVTAGDGSVLARDGVAQLVELVPLPLPESTLLARVLSGGPRLAALDLERRRRQPGLEQMSRGYCVNVVTLTSPTDGPCDASREARLWLLPVRRPLEGARVLGESTGVAGVNVVIRAWWRWP